ncbi:MAG TPA: N-acetyl-gamma-glutamyl-phosphate reductase, partial [Ktedonobacteraceae bacterium]|nr:N-acetyl-gamma-glutamyl-phosphate reductase [Ktedonobacteraceae bacterium]
MISVSIVNVTSYTGLELLRLLAQHPHFSVRSATGRSAVGKRLDEVFPQLRLQPDKRDTLQAGINPELVISEELAQTDLAFVCLPHAAAAESIV